MRYSTVLFCIVASIAGAGCGWLDDRPAPVDGAAYTASGQLSNARLTTAHDTFGSAVNEYFRVGSKPQQPIEFPHNTHIEKGLTCTEYCHEAVTKGPQAGLPSVNTCLICHAAIATDKPRIQQITQMSEKGIDLNWQRVYGYGPQCARQVQSRAAHPRQRRMRDVSWRHRAPDGCATQCRPQYGVLRELSSGEKSPE